MIRTQNWLDRGNIPEEWVAIPREHFVAYIRSHNEVGRLRAEAAEWEHRAIGGQCKILSEDKCDCSLCVRDAEIERLRAENRTLVIQKALAEERVDELLDDADEIERLRKLCCNAAHWLILPPTTDSDRNIVINLSRKLKEAAGAAESE